MLKKTIKYTDYDGVEREEDFYFNLSKAELMEMQAKTVGGLDAFIKKIVSTKDVPSIMEMFKDLILRCYGEKSADGKRFIKSEQLSKDFSETEAYSELFMELATDSKSAAEFVNGVIPASLRKQLDDDALKQQALEVQK